MTKFFRYSGSKIKYTQRVNELIQNSNKNTYIEPFVGSGSILFNLDINFERYIINDIDRNIIRIYNTFKEITYDNYLDEYNHVIKTYGDFTIDRRRLNKIEGEKSKESFYNFRNDFNTNYWGKDSIKEGIQLHLLASSCINSMLRFGSKGMNQSFGLKMYKLSQENFININKVLQRTEIFCGDYRDVIIDDSLVFLDPPYIKQASSYTSFDNNSFWRFIKEVNSFNNRNIDFIYTDIINSGNSHFNKEYIKTMRNTSPQKNNGLEIGHKEYYFSNLSFDDGF